MTGRSTLTVPIGETNLPRPRTEEHLFREPVAVSTEFTVRLPTSFASEVARAKAIADAEAEEKKRREAARLECDRIISEIETLKSSMAAVAEHDNEAREDHRHILEYLRSLRIRQGK